MIPKTIHQIWLGPRPRPSDMMDTWREKHPDWSYHVWTEETIDYPLHNQEQYEAMKDFGGKADVLRYEILNRHGGVYVDADMTCLKPLEPSFLGSEFFAAYENERRRPGLIANGLIGCTAGHPVMQRMIERIHQLDTGRLGDADASLVTGPYAFTDEVEAHGGAVVLFPSHLFYPEHYLSAFRSDAEDSYSRHDWYSTYPTICLTMVIRRDTANLWGCLPRIKPHIEAYRIGLSRRDAPRSVEIIETVLGDLPGNVLEIGDAVPEEAWNEILRSAEGVADYSLMADQDTILYDFRRNMLRRNHDCYEINEHRDGAKHPVSVLVRADGSWRCSGSTPFSVNRTEPGEQRTLLGCCHLRRLEPPPIDVSRHIDEEQLLLEELDRRPDQPEPLFYLGQHAEDTGDPAQAIRYYEKRVEAGAENTQVWEASMRIARCLRTADAPWSEVEEALKNAHRLDPLRPDPLVELGAEARRQGDHDQAVEYLVRATSLPAPENHFYWDTWLRQLALEHLCVSGYYAGRFAEGLRAGLEALQGESAGMGRGQIIRNIGFYLDKVDIRSLDQT